MSVAAEPDATEEVLEQAKTPFLRRVQIRGYKSIAFCDVTLEPLTILVGRNATGKSNFLDALSFVRDVLNTNITEATRRRGGWQAIVNRLSPDGAVHFEFEIDTDPVFAIDDDKSSGANRGLIYDFTLQSGSFGLPVLIRESFRMLAGSSSSPRYEANGHYDSTTRAATYQYDFQHKDIPCSLVPCPSPDRLWIGSFGKQPFLNVVEGLRQTGYYDFNPKSLRAPCAITRGELLESDGKNLASVLETTRMADPWAFRRIAQYLAAVTRTAEFADVLQVGGYELLRFRVPTSERDSPLAFDAAAMSDGTLRVLATVAAAFQVVPPHGSPSLVAIEEPETSLHPAALRALVAALDEATQRTQILLTTHSPDLLDAPEIKPENVRVVQMIDGRTVIGRMDEASVGIVKDHLSTLGGLERDRQLEPDAADLERQADLGRQGQDAP